MAKEREYPHRAHWRALLKKRAPVLVFSRKMFIDWPGWDHTLERGTQPSGDLNGGVTWGNLGSSPNLGVQKSSFSDVRTVLEFVKWSPGCQMLRHGSIKHHKRNKNREVYYSQALETHTVLSRGATRAGKARVQAGREGGPGAHAFIRVHGRILWGPQAKVGLVNSSQKEQGLGQSHKGPV